MSTKTRIVDLTRTSFVKEAKRIQQRAHRGETVVVRLAQLVFFCANQDAWMLDLDDKFARCLMRDGVALPHGITETKRQFTIQWNADYAIEGGKFRLIPNVRCIKNAEYASACAELHPRVRKMEWVQAAASPYP